MPDSDAALRELNHRIKNNFQIIVSLMNLRKRMLPPERRDEIRFIEEHVQSMSAAYRLVYASGYVMDVALSELVAEVITGLREVAGVASDALVLNVDDIDTTMGLDHAIGLALFLAVAAPPFLDRARASGGTLVVAGRIAADRITLWLYGDWDGPVLLDVLRTRMLQAYAGQLGAVVISATERPELRLSFALTSDLNASLR